MDQRDKDLAAKSKELRALRAKADGGGPAPVCVRER